MNRSCSPPCFWGNPDRKQDNLNFPRKKRVTPGFYLDFLRCLFPPFPAIKGRLHLQEAGGKTELSFVYGHSDNFQIYRGRKSRKLSGEQNLACKNFPDDKKKLKLKVCDKKVSKFFFDKKCVNIILLQHCDVCFIFLC